MKKNNEYIIRKYHCRICDTVHSIKLKNDLLKGREKYPFSYSYLHGNLKNLLTTLYLDMNLEIRGVDVQELSDDDIFSKDQVVSITKTLMEEIERLREENMELQEQLKKLKKT
jgi:hypothetical protein